MKKNLLFAIATAVLAGSVTAHAGDKFVVDGIQYEIMDDGSGVMVAPSTDRDGYTGNVTVPATVKNGNITYKVVGVGKNAFQWCEVDTVILPNTVVLIEQYAFNASDVKKLDMGTGVEKIVDGALAVVKELEDLSEIPACCTEIQAGAFSMTNSLKEFKINPENPVYKVVDGCIYSKSGKTLYAVPFGMQPAELVIPEGCDSVANNACNTYMDLLKVTFPSTLKYVGVGAFTYCNQMVNTNDFPESLEVIGASAFSSCYKLKDLTIKPTVTLVGGMAFNNAVTPVEVHVGSQTVLGANAFSSGRSVISKVTFDTPEVTTVVPTFAFQYSKVEEIILPEGYTEIEGRAFAQTSKCRKIDLPSTLTTMGVAPFEKDSVDTLISRAVTPPVYNNYNNPNYPLLNKTCWETVKVYVPDESIAAYKEANGFSDFTNILPLSQLAGIEDVIVEDIMKAVDSETYFDLSGRQVAPAVDKKGLYIVRTKYSDGTVKTGKRVF